MRSPEPFAAEKEVSSALNLYRSDKTNVASPVDGGRHWFPYDMPRRTNHFQMTRLSVGALVLAPAVGAASAPTPTKFQEFWEESLSRSLYYIFGGVFELFDAPPRGLP